MSDSRASTRTRLSVLPVFMALLFNVVAPIATVAVPDSAPLSADPVAAAAPEQVTFTLEGCNLTTGTFIESTLTCTEPGYTTGNLGKLWAELDRVPHRLTAENKTVAQTYDIKLSADYLDDGFLGYDQISVPTLKSGACTFTVSDQFADAGVAGGADETISRTMTVTQPPNSTCVFDFNMRLALGSAQYPGSSLRAYLIAEGVGAKSVPLPVDKDFPAQELRKEMTATQGQAYGWSVSKSSDPTSLHFANTCLPDEAARAATVDVTISWTRTGPTASGNTLITTKVYAENPSERTIQVSVTDDIFTGSAATNAEATKISTASAGPINVPANSEVLVLEHVFEYNGTATQFNDVATATYIDPVNADVAIPGNTTAAASATTQPAGGDPDNSTAIITDSEWITGDGLSFSVDTPNVGSFTNGYVAGNEVLPGATVDWSSGVVSGNGSVTFTKTVYLDEPRIITSGAALSDAATVLSADGQATLATSGQLDIGITADAEVSLTIDKTIPAGALRTGESVTFDFAVYAGSEASGDPVATTSISFDAGGATAKSATVTGLEPGTYTVHEVPEPNWMPLDDQTTSIALPSCSAVVEFDNTELTPDLSATKAADAASVSAGARIGFTIMVSNGDDIGTGIAKGVEVDDLLPGGDGIDWSIAGDSQDDGDCVISGALGSEVLECDFGDLAPGASASVHVVSDTTAASCKLYENTATVSASNLDQPLTPSDDTEVLCPDVGLNIDKFQSDAQGNEIDEVIIAGETAYFVIHVWNEGPGEARDVVMNDDLPAGLDWEFDVIAGDGECFPASSQEEGGEPQMSLACNLGNLAAGDDVKILVWALTDRTDCGPLVNDARVGGSNDDEVPPATATILVSCPELSLIKEADAEVITITIDGDDQSVDPEVVTWTLTYTLTNGSVTNAVITDELPDGLVYVDGSASDGGVYDAATDTLTWTFPTLSESGSVTFQTEVDPETISRVAPTVNVAVISSDQTPEDEGEDQVTVTVEQELGGNPTPTRTPAPQLPDTATGTGLGDEPITVPVELLAAAFIASLGALALANVKARSRRW